MLTRPRPAKGTFNTPEYRAAVANFTEEAFDGDSPEIRREAVEQDRLEALDTAATARPDLPSQLSEPDTSASTARSTPAKATPEKATPAKATPAKAIAK